MKMKKQIIKYKGREIEINVREMRGLNKALGLMVYKKDALLFEFGKDVMMSIHSFFCPKFVAIWLDSKNEVVDVKKVFSHRMSISPLVKFRKLIEIPLNKKYLDIIKFIDEASSVRKI